MKGLVLCLGMLVFMLTGSVSPMNNEGYILSQSFFCSSISRGLPQKVLILGCLKVEKASVFVTDEEAMRELSLILTGFLQKLGFNSPKILECVNASFL